MGEFIGLSVPNLSGNERKYMDEAIDSEWVSTAGPYIPQFEKGIADYVGAPDAVACQNGSSGLHLAFLELGVGTGDAVIVPDLTFAATVNPVVYCGANPIFVDCDDTLCLDPVKLREFITEECEHIGGRVFEKSTGFRVAAIAPVHVFGNLCDMDAIMDVAEEFKIPVVEDACESLGSRFTSGRYAGMHSGTVGDIGVFSFNGNKIITTGGGGMIVARDPQKLAHMRYKSQQAKDDAVRFIHNELGYNYRMTNIQAALGMAQLEQLDGFIEIKKRNYELYNRLGIELLPFSLDRCNPNYWFYSFMTERREELMSKLAERNIGTRPIWELMHRLPAFSKYRSYRLEKSIYYHKYVLNLPCSSNLTEEQVHTVADAIKEILGK